MKSIITVILLSVSLLTVTHKALAETLHDKHHDMHHEKNHDMKAHEMPEHKMEQKAGQDIVIHNPTITITPPGITNSAGYFHLMNHSDKEIELINAKSGIAKRTEIHQHTMNDGVMKMQKVDALAIPAKSTIHFEPGGYHIMFIAVNEPIIEKQRVELTLEFSDGTSQTITVTAQEPKASHRNKHKHHGG